MIKKSSIFYLCFLCWLSGCSAFQASKLIAPTTFGLGQLSSNIYVESGADHATRMKLQKDVAKAQSEIVATFGSAQSVPIVHACVTEGCYRQFGGYGSIAKVYGRRILLSPRGLSWQFLAHEWSHTEMSERLTFLAWRRMPQWFDEGLAVAVSQAPEHSEEHWQFLIDSNTPHPSRNELITYRTLNEWLAAVMKFGEPENPQRKARGEPEIRPVYAAAGHEVRLWLAKARTSGLMVFIDRLNHGDDFDQAYRSVPENTAR
ncbi:MAG: hypothetical protein H7315_22390 [Herminiimonas sp.]|nr:hypothetical protein [Herminiimonas sp.]